MNIARHHRFSFKKLCFSLLNQSWLFTHNSEKKGNLYFTSKTKHSNAFLKDYLEFSLSHWQHVAKPWKWARNFLGLVSIFIASEMLTLKYAGRRLLVPWSKVPRKLGLLKKFFDLELTFMTHFSSSFFSSSSWFNKKNYFEIKIPI